MKFNMELGNYIYIRYVRTTVMYHVNKKHVGYVGCRGILRCNAFFFVQKNIKLFVSFLTVEVAS